MTNELSSAAPGAVDMVHHMSCAYVGPALDFGKADGDKVCPKCRRMLKPDAVDWEVLVVTKMQGR